MNEIMQYFKYEHLPEQLQEVSKPLCDVAEKMNEDLPNGPEKSAGLRKLLEAKDCFVRSALSAAPKVTALVVLTVIGFVLSQQATAGGGRFFGRQNFRSCSTGHCVPNHSFHHNNHVAPSNIQANFIQNNFPPAVGSTLYGYPQAYSQPLTYNPFQVDPNAVLREVARANESTKELYQEGIQAYTDLGSQAFSLAAQNDQLRARAELLRASEPQPLTQPQTQPYREQLNTQSFSAGQTITIGPDGHGGLKITVGEAASHTETSSAPSPSGASIQSEAIAVMQNRCASCHTGSSSKGGFAMFDGRGQLANLTSNDSAEILKKVNLGLMPPARNDAGQPIPELTPKERAVLEAFLSE